MLTFIIHKLVEMCHTPLYDYLLSPVQSKFMLSTLDIDTQKIAPGLLLFIIALENAKCFLHSTN